MRFPPLGGRREGFLRQAFKLTELISSGNIFRETPTTFPEEGIAPPLAFSKIFRTPVVITPNKGIKNRLFSYEISGNWHTTSGQNYCKIAIYKHKLHRGQRILWSRLMNKLIKTVFIYYRLKLLNSILYILNYKKF